MFKRKHNTTKHIDSYDGTQHSKPIYKQQKSMWTLYSTAGAVIFNWFGDKVECIFSHISDMFGRTNLIWCRHSNKNRIKLSNSTLGRVTIRFNSKWKASKWWFSSIFCKYIQMTNDPIQPNTFQIVPFRTELIEICNAIIFFLVFVS